MIKGGYYLKARCIQNAEIASAPPHVREIWDWLLKEANHKDNDTCKRGQCIRSYKDIQNGLKWFVGYRKMKYKKHQCENSMKWLKKATMITTTKTTRGVFITICNYDKYQNPSNYESHTRTTTKATMEPQCSHTINKKKKNEKNDKKKKEGKNLKPPSLENIKEYSIKNDLNVDCDFFYKYFTEGNWIDSKGNKVKSWKQKLLTWNKSNNKTKTKTKTPLYNYGDNWIEEGMQL